MEFDKPTNRGLIATALALFIAFAMFALRAAILNSPLISGDEYTHFVSGQYFPHTDVPGKLDPMLPQVGMQIQLAIERLWFLTGRDHAALFGKVWNSAVYVLAALPLGLALMRVFGTRVALLTCIGYLTLPMSLYSAMVMPESDYVFATYTLLCAYVWLWPARPFLFAGLGGAVLGMGFLIKPQGIALLAATVAALLASRWLRAAIMAWPRLAACVALTCASAYGTAVLLIWLLTGKLLLTLADLVGGFYFGVAGEGFKLTYWLNNIRSIAKYAVAHGTVMLFVVPFGVVGVTLALTSAAGFAESAARQAAHRLFAVFAISALVMVIAMVSVFTHLVGAANTFEAGRLQGRMVNFLLPLLLAEAIYLATQPHKRWFRGVAVVWTVAGLMILFWIVPYFTLYPWDNAELFALFRHPNHYSWNWTWRGAALGEYIGWIVLGAAVIAIWRVDIAPRLAIAAFAAFMLVAQLQANAWAYSQSSTTVRDYADAALAVKTLVGSRQGSEGKGLVVGSDRYGRMSMVLFHLGAAQHVKQLPVGQAIKAGDVPAGVEWMILTDRYPVEVPYAKSVRVGVLELYTFRNTPPYVFEGEKVLWKGEPISLKFQDTGDVGALSGFNDPEAWGSWSAREDAYAMLPVLVEGPITLRMFGWTVAANLVRPLRIRVGGTTHDMQLTDKPAWHELSFDVRHAADRVSFIYPPYRETPWARPVGVGISEIQIVRRQ